jgi:hypothetical protein
MPQETEETTAGMSQTRTRLWALGLAVIPFAFGLLISFLLLRWNGGTSATEQAKNLVIKKPIKR